MGRVARVGRGGLRAVAPRELGVARMAEWDVGMLRRAAGGGRMAQLVRETAGGRRSVVELVGQRLVEHEFWDGLGLGGIEGRGLVEKQISLGRAAGRRDGRGRAGQLEVLQDGDDDGRVGEEGENPHGAATCGAQKRQHLVDAGFILHLVQRM